MIHRTKHSQVYHIHVFFTRLVYVSIACIPYTKTRLKKKYIHLFAILICLPAQKVVRHFAQKQSGLFVKFADRLFAPADDIILLKDHRRFPKERGFMNIRESAALNMDGFICTLVQSISSALGPDVEVTASEQQKNNQISYPCLTIRHPDRRVSPNIRIDELFNTYKNGQMNIDEITEKISSAFDNISNEKIVPEDLCSDPSKAAERVFFRLVNYERNSEALENYPHFRFLDLAIVFCLNVSLPNKESGAIRIDNKIASLIGADADRLMTLAVKNTPVLYPSNFEGLDELLIKIMKKRGIPDFMIPLFSGNTPALHTPMKVLSNDREFYGASCIIYPGVLEKIRNEIGQDFYILPSSINEVIIVPSDCADAVYLTDMVRDVNRTVIPPEEILSDNVYRYPDDFGPDVIGPLFSKQKKTGRPTPAR